MAALFVLPTPNLTYTADANEFASFPTSNSHYSDCWSCAGVGVKQFGELFQLVTIKFESDQREFTIM
ncbi:hypothetical protein F6P84_05565 [Streptococcus suis]|nr:hypothetical protein [Streptococcus suis]MBS8039734.1 hypothetical protein [Streptococcus suis]MBS8051950.1 hypothetical protein [Streptococcus suis]MBS8053966.1 hypothetical protein [Streptococcus suis]MBS8061228.1 hypothetical protein [Streptococcus suis]